MAAKKPAPPATRVSFSTPAMIKDLAGPAQVQLDCHWNRHIEAFTQQAVTGDPWNSGYIDNGGRFVPAPVQASYFDPTTTSIPAGTPAVAVTWNAFPNRLITYCGSNTPSTNPYNLTQQQIWELADTGRYSDAGGVLRPFPAIPQVLCPSPQWGQPLRPFGPYGPRGWQDEYCEWSVTRDANGKITRVDFVCENPEYWNTLWRVSPERVAQHYQNTLNAGLPAGSPNAVAVTVDDLSLKQPGTSVPVVDRFTGGPVYDPLNKWNTGPESVRGRGATGGAMHLTSTPNTLQTEMGLAGAATVLRAIGNVDAGALICCAQYGQPNRNSDPHIGQSVNQVVSDIPARTTLADPVGLYIQMPDFSNYTLPPDPMLPAGARAADCWQVVRGSATLVDPVTGQLFPGSFILHAVFQLPAAWIAAGVSFTVGDITIRSNGKALPIAWAGQIAETFDVGLFARALAAPAAAPVGCVVNLDTTAQPPLPPAQAQPIQLMDQTLWAAYYGTSVSNVMGVAMNLASNSVIIPMPVKPGEKGVRAVLILATAISGPGGALPSVTVPGGQIVVTVKTASALQSVTYAAPGNSYPGDFQLLDLTIDVAPTAPSGLYPIVVANPGTGAPAALPGPAFLSVFAPDGSCV